MRKVLKYFINIINSEDYILCVLLGIYPALIATYNYKLAIFMITVFAISLMTTRIFIKVGIKYVKKEFAYNIAFIYISTYSTIVYLISNAIFPSDMKIIILPLMFITTSVLIELKYRNKYNSKNIGKSLIDGIVYFISALCLVSVVSILNLFDIYKRQSGFNFLIIGIILILINYFKKHIHKYINN